MAEPDTGLSEQGTESISPLREKKVRRALFPLLDKRFQIKVTLFFLLLILLSHLFLMFIHWRNWNQTTTGLVGKSAAQIEYFKRQQTRVFTRDLFLGVVSIGILVGLVVFFLTQKVSGPLFAISRVLDDFSRGDYQKRVRLRQSDELKWFAEKVNESLNVIESKVGENSSD